jgi:hypothetical protein
MISGQGMLYWARIRKQAALTVLLLILIAPEVIRMADVRRRARQPVAGRPGSQLAQGRCGEVASTNALAAPNYFPDVTARIGIDFRHVVGPLGTFYLPEINGSGAGLFDCDGNGLLDLLLINGNRSPRGRGTLSDGARLGHRLYLQRAPGQFEDATEASGIGGQDDFGVGCATGDVDNDGDLDVYITCVGPDRFYLNDGRGNFSEIASQAGLSNPDYGTCATFFDYDRDGWLDLLVVNYVADPAYQYGAGCGFADGRVSYCGPLMFRPTVDRLFHNETAAAAGSKGLRVRFREVTAEAGLANAPTNGFGVISADFNGDHWPDLFVANDAGPNRLWISQRNGTFVDEAVELGAAFSGDGRPQAGMGAVAGDVDNDGDLDLLATHLMNEYATLYRQVEGGMFTDASHQARLTGGTSAHTGWGAAFVDVDHDGYLDLPIVNGAVVPCELKFPPHGEKQFQQTRISVPDADAYWRQYASPNLLYLNDQVGRFRDQSGLAPEFSNGFGSGRALAIGDIDNDGDIDLVVTSCGQKARVFRNDLPKRGHWLSVRAFDPKLRRDALGAQVTVVTREGRLVRLAGTGGGYLSAHDPRTHFGMGEAADFQAVEIRWPDGLLERFAGGRSDRFITLNHGDGARQEETAGVGP